MHSDAVGVGRILAIATTIGVTLSGQALAQCGTEVSAGLRFPLGIALSNQNNLLVSESGMTAVEHSGRISIIDKEGVRRTLLDGLPSAINDVNDASGPAGLIIRAVRCTSRSASATPSSRPRLGRQ